MEHISKTTVETLNVFSSQEKIEIDGQMAYVKVEITTTAFGIYPKANATARKKAAKKCYKAAEEEYIEFVNKNTEN
jgi:hypothetical protein